MLESEAPHRRRAHRAGTPAATLLAVLAAIVVVTAFGPIPARPVEAADVAGRYELMTPTRILDSRPSGPPSTGPFDLRPWSGGYVNLTVTDVAAEVFLRFGPCGAPPTRQLLMAPGSASLVSFGSDACITSDLPVHLIADLVGREGTSGATGQRYVGLGDPADLFGPVAPIAPGSYPVDLGSAVPSSAAGVALVLHGRSDSGSPGNYAGIVPCGTPLHLPQLILATPDDGDVNVVHVARPPGTALCLVVVGDRSAVIRVGLLGYFVDGPGAGDVVPAFESRPEVRPGLVPRPPTRVLDTRNAIGTAGGKVGAGEVVRLDLSAAVTPSTAAVSLAVTATEPEADGYITAFGCADGRPDSSNLNYETGATVPNLVIVNPDEDGDVCVFTFAATHLLIDLGGTYEWGAGLGFSGDGPRRVLDTRSTARATAGSITRVQLASPDATEVPSAVTVNLTAAEPQAWGYVTAYPCDQQRPEVSNLNYIGGRTVAGLATVKLAADGSLCLFSFGATHLIVDLAGSYSSAATGRLQLLTPSRRLDTRTANYGISPARTWWNIPVEGNQHDGTVTAVFANLTATGATASGFLSATTCTSSTPTTSALNHAAGTDVANLAVMPVVADAVLGQKYCVYNSAPTHVLVDAIANITSAPYVRTVISGVG